MDDEPIEPAAAGAPGGASDGDASDPDDACSPGAAPRFDRQERFAPLGAAGQRRLEASRVLVVGCGALGGVLAQTLVRAGVGALVLVDRDVVEPSNLPRQVLFDERHAAQGAPKALAAAESLARVGGPTRVEPHAAHVDGRNLAALAEDCDLVLDGTDNLETRYLLNDYALEHGLPWVYAGVVGGSGLVLPVRPGDDGHAGACLRCLFPSPPPPGTLPTCDTAGVILPAVGVVASLAAGLGLRLLVDPEGLEPALIEVDVWNGAVRRLGAPRDPACPACGPARERAWLFAPPAREPVVLCGRDTVQLPPRGRAFDLAAIAGNVADVASELVRTAVLLRFRVDDVRLTLFADGRALVEGTTDPDRARAVYDRTVGL